jgi:hypothetical protein
MDFLPGDHLAVVGTGEPPELVIEGFARRCGKAGSNRRGFLSVSPEHLMFTYNRWFRVWLERIERERIQTARLNRRLLCDLLELNTKDGKVIRFLFTRTRGALVARVVTELNRPSEAPQPTTPEPVEPVPAAGAEG